LVSHRGFFLRSPLSRSTPDDTKPPLGEGHPPPLPSRARAAFLLPYQREGSRPPPFPGGRGYSPCLMLSCPSVFFFSPPRGMDDVHLFFFLFKKPKALGSCASFSFSRRRISLLRREARSFFTTSRSGSLFLCGSLPLTEEEGGLAIEQDMDVPQAPFLRHELFPPLFFSPSKSSRSGLPLPAS